MTKPCHLSGLSHLENVQKHDRSVKQTKHYESVIDESNIFSPKIVFMDGAYKGFEDTKWRVLEIVDGLNGYVELELIEGERIIFSGGKEYDRKKPGYIMKLRNSNSYNENFPDNCFNNGQLFEEFKKNE